MANTNNSSKKKDNSSKTNTTKKTTSKKVENKKVKENNVKKEVSATKKEEKVVTANKKEEKVVATPVKEKIVKEKKDTNSVKKSFKLTSKQRDIVLILLVVVLLVVAAVVTSSRNPKLDIELPVALEGQAGFAEITYAQYEEKMANKNPFLVVIVRDGCHFCEEYEPILKEVAPEYNVPIYYINLSHLTNEEATSLSKSNSYLRTKKWGTPTTLLLYGDAVVDSIGGYVEKDTFVSFLEKNVKVDK